MSGLQEGNDVCSDYSSTNHVAKEFIDEMLSLYGLN